MDCREYKKSAVRHYTTCEHLLEQVVIKKGDDKAFLLQNIYYLSGYVIETALSYAYFSHIQFKGDVEDSEEYMSGFKTHKFDTKIKFLNAKKGDISSLPFISLKVPDRKLTNLYQYWSTDFRYSLNDQIRERDISHEVLEKYLQQLKLVLSTILKRF